MKKTFAIASALAVGLASSASAQLRLKGSDTLFEMTNEMLSLCGISSGAGGIIYDGGGSSGGQNAMTANPPTQYVSPMSRFINTTGCNSTTAPGTAATRSGYAHSLDALAIFSDNTENTDCDVLRHTGAMTVTDQNGVAGLQCPTCTGAGSDQYTFASWQQVLRVIYSGRHNVISANECAFDAPGAPSGETSDCNSDVRRTLVNNWGNLFEGSCTDGECTALKHAFRRDDISGTTDTFLTLLSLPGLFGGTGGGYNGQGVFCNGSEFEDKDPIRRTCSGNGNTAGENVCQRVTRALEVPNVGPTVNPDPATNPGYPVLDTVWPQATAANTPTAELPGDLGLVLPIVMPVTADQYTNNNNCAVGAFKLAEMPSSSVVGLQYCPDGTSRILNRCYWPLDAAGQFGCLNTSTNQRAGSGLFIQRYDGRVYNLTPRRQTALGTIPTVPRKPTATGNAVNRPLLNVAYYRLHQRSPLAEGTPALTCREGSDTNQIGCFVKASPCSLGFAGLGASQTDNKTLDMRAPLAATGAVAATPVNVRKLLESDAGGAAGTCPNYGSRYPLSRKLWFNTFVGFTALQDAASPATAAEKQLARCWADRRFVDRAAVFAGFIPLTDSTCLTDALPADPANPGTPASCLLDEDPFYETSTCALNP